MEINKTNQNLVHNIIIENKKSVTISGITDVDCFDERAIRMYTQMGELTIEGKDLHINSMNVETGDLQIEGEVTALIYGSPNVKSPLTALGKLFR